MIMAEKLTELRKKYGLTQESLADELNISRQAISKWESAQSVPDLKNLEKISRLFNVSLDFLIKDELEMTNLNTVEESLDINKNITRFISLQEASDYFTYIDRTAPKIAIAVALCILSIIPLIILAVLSDLPQSGINENMIGLIGIPLTFIFLIPAIIIFIVYGIKGKRFDYLKKEAIDTAYGVSGMVKDRKLKLEQLLIIHITTGVVLCLIAFIILVAASSLAEIKGEQWQALSSLSFILIAVAVYLFVNSGIRKNALKVLMQEGNYHPKQRIINNKMDLISGIYWLSITAVYLGYSFITYAWDRSWIIWPIAAIVFAIIHTIVEAVLKAEK